MEVCKYRIPVEPNKTSNNNENVEEAANIALRKSRAPLPNMAVAGSLCQTFKNGLCQFLTVRDIGPVECLQPNHGEESCPDIRPRTKGS